MRIYTPYIARLDVEQREVPDVLDVLNEGRLALSMLFGWDDNALMWRRVLVDSAGRLALAASFSKTHTGHTFSHLASSSVTTVLSDNPNRVSWLIKNNGSVTVYIGFSSSLTAANGLPLYPGDVISDDSYTGPVYVITDSGTSDLRVMETEL